MKIDLEQIKMVWEDFNSNYIPPDKIESGEDIFDEDGVKTDLFDQLNMLNGMGDHIAKTPWGVFKKDDKMAPHNFYELKLIHFGGFSSENFSFKDENGSPKNKLSTALGNAAGVAVWKFMDPYCFIIGKARLYEWKEVIKAVETAIKNEIAIINENDGIVNIVEPKKQDESKNSLLIYDLIAKQMINEFKKNNVDDGSLLVFFPNGKYDFAIKSDEDYNERVQNIEELIKEGEVSLVYRNGQPC